MRKRKNPRKRRANLVAISDYQRAYLLTGVAFDFLKTEGDKTKPFPSVAATKRSWQVHKTSLLEETGSTCKPWAWCRFVGDGAKLPRTRRGKRGAPIFPDATQSGKWPMDRPDIWTAKAHQWHSEYARPATEHLKYKLACKMARAGTNDAGMRWDPVWLRTWSDVEATLSGCWFDDAKASHAVAFFRLLRHTKGEFASRPFVLLPWQEFDVIRPLFGWQQVGEIRRYSNGYIEIPKKNGKSTLCSGISLYLLIADNEPGAEVYNCASDRKQATIVFKEAMRMAKKCPYINRLLRYRDSIKRIDYDVANGEYEALSSDVGTKEGMNISGLVFDELHAQKNRDLFDALIYGGAARLQPLFLAITTAGTYDPTSIGWEQHSYARRVLEGGAGPAEDWGFFSYIRCVVLSDPDKKGGGMEWTDPAWWHRANPSLAVAIPLDKFAQECKTAAEVPSKQNSFKRYKANLWVQAREIAFKASDWAACLVDNGANGYGVHDKLCQDLVGRRCFGGLDLSSTADLTAAALWFPPIAGENHGHLITRFWLPEDNILELERKARAPYTTWAAGGWLDLTPGDMVDYQMVRQGICEWSKTFQPVNWRFDRWSAAGLVTQLAEDDGLEMVEFGQGYGWMNSPTKEFERLIVSGQLRHPGNPVLDWMIGNCELDRDSEDRIKIVKARKNIRLKVDGPVASVMALDGGMRDTGPQKSAYEDMELVTI